jgi:septal ring factor EnvC (AmiA/AmiB activator)
MAMHDLMRNTILCVTLAGASLAAMAAPPPAAHLRKQLKDVDARIAAARAHHDALRAQVAQMEQQNAARQKQLQQRDAEIAALQEKLQAAGIPASVASSDRR